MSKCPVDLWRGVHVDDFPNGPIVDGEAVAGVMYPTFERKRVGTHPDGQPKYRKADVVVIDGKVQPGGGTSLYDKSQFFRGGNWKYLSIPAGTEMDPNLKLVGPHWNELVEANHYQLEALKPMYLAVFKGAMDNLARAAVKRAYENAREQHRDTR